MANTPDKQYTGRLLSPEFLRRLTFLVLIVGVTYWFFDLVRPFLMTIFWAVVLTIVFKPFHRWLLKKMPSKKGLAATVTTLAIFLVVLLPLSVIVLSVVNEGIGLVGKVNSGELDPNMVIKYVEDRIPIVQDFATSYGVDFEQLKGSVREAVANAGQWLGNKALNTGQNFLGVAVEFFLMLYFLWFFLYDGERIMAAIIRALPLGDRDEKILFERFATVSRATLKGTAIVALAQGSLGGILFWAVGIDGPLFWAVLMTLLSLLPVGGAALIWFPAAVVLAIQGMWGKAIIVVAVGGLAIGLIDNLLRPLLVGRDTKMPDYVVLVATLGGIASFGLGGFVIGPIVAALFITVWEMVSEEFEETPSPTTEG